MCLQSHLVAAFEKSLSNMTCRLQSLTMTAEQKVQEFSSELEVYSAGTSQKLYYKEEKWLKTARWAIPKYSSAI